MDRLIIFNLNGMLADLGITNEEIEKNYGKLPNREFNQVKPLPEGIRLLRDLSSSSSIYVLTSLASYYGNEVIKMLEINVRFRPIYYHDWKEEGMENAIKKIVSESNVMYIYGIGTSLSEINLFKSAFEGNTVNSKTILYENNTIQNLAEKLSNGREYDNKPDFRCKLPINIKNDMAISEKRGLDAFYERDGYRWLIDYYKKQYGYDGVACEIFCHVKNPDGRPSRLDIYTSFKKTFVKFFKESGFRSEKCGFLIVPSSHKNKYNDAIRREIVNPLINELKVIDSVENVYRKADKETAHNGGDRTVETNIASLGTREFNKNVEYAFVFDDIVTSGNSFKAVKSKIIEMGIPEKNIYFFALAGTLY